MEMKVSQCRSPLRGIDSSNGFDATFGLKLDKRTEARRAKQSARRQLEDRALFKRLEKDLGWF